MPSASAVKPHVFQNPEPRTATRPLRVAWFSFFPVEWLDDVPPEIAALTKGHPATWQQVLLEELEQRNDLELHIVVLRKQFPRPLHFRRRGVQFHCLKTVGGLRAPSFFWLDTLLIGRQLRRVQPDLVHAWGTEHGAALVSSRLGYPAVVTTQGLLTWLGTLTPLARYHRFAAWVERFTLRRVPLITAESSFAVGWLKSHFPQARLEQIEHAPRWLFHRIERRPQTAPVRFVYVGSVTQLKGADLLIRALDRLRSEFNFELTLVSDPARGFLDTLRPEIAPETWNRIRFRDNLTSAQIAGEFATATLFLFPTRADVSPNSVKEAVAAGVPVVGSRVGGLVDYVIPGKNGILFEGGSLDGFVQAIRAALQHPLFSRGLVDPETLARMREYLSPATMGRRFAEVYRLAAASPRS